MSGIKKLFSPYKGLPREIYILFFSRIINSMGCFVMPLLTIILTKSIGLSYKEAGFYAMVSGCAYLPGSLIGGKLTDMFGRKNIILVSNTIAASLYIYCGFIPPTIRMVYILILASGIFAFSGPAQDSLVADLTTPENRTGAYALSYMGWNLGFSIGPIVGGLLYKNHLPLVFIGDGLTTILSLLLILVFVKETIGLSRAEINDDSRRLEKREEGSIFSVLMKRPILIYFALIMFGYNFVYAEWGFLIPLQVVRNFGGMGSVYYGFLASFNGLVVIIFTPLITRILLHKNNIRRMIYGGILYTVGFGMLGLIYALPYFFVSVFIFTLGEITITISSTPFIANHTPSSHRGRMSAVLPIIFGSGHTISTLVVGSVLMHMSMESTWLMSASVTLVCSGLMYLLEKYDRKGDISSKSLEA